MFNSAKRVLSYNQFIKLNGKLLMFSKYIFAIELLSISFCLPPFPQNSDINSLTGVWNSSSWNNAFRGCTSIGNHEKTVFSSVPTAIEYLSVKYSLVFNKKLSFYGILIIPDVHNINNKTNFLLLPIRLLKNRLPKPYIYEIET
jgi:hypothetical protein